MVSKIPMLISQWTMSMVYNVIFSSNVWTKKDDIEMKPQLFSFTIFQFFPPCLKYKEEEKPQRETAHCQVLKQKSIISHRSNKMSFKGCHLEMPIIACYSKNISQQLLLDSNCKFFSSCENVNLSTWSNFYLSIYLSSIQRAAQGNVSVSKYRN